MSSIWQETKYVGTGFLQDNGTIILNLKREVAGIVLHDELRYDPSNPNYQAVLEHISPIKPGERVSVTPWNQPRH